MPNEDKKTKIAEKLEAHWNSLLDIANEIRALVEAPGDIAQEAADELKRAARIINDEVIDRLISPEDF